MTTVGACFNSVFEFIKKIPENIRKIPEYIKILAELLSTQEAKLGIQSVLVEFLAMMIFLYISCGTVMTFLAPPSFQYNDPLERNSTSGGPYLHHIDSNFGIIVPFVFGSTVMILAYVACQFNAGHLNPAVTISLALLQKINWIKAIGFVAAQLAGGLFAMTFLLITIPNATESGFGANKLSPGVSTMDALVGETFLTMVLVLVVLYSSDHADSQVIAPIAIGFTVFVAHGILLPMDGCSINTIRSFAPAVYSGTWDNFWVFAAGPIVGSLIAVGIYFLNTQINKIQKTQQDQAEELHRKQQEEEEQQKKLEEERQFRSVQAEEPSGDEPNQPESPTRPSLGEHPSAVGAGPSFMEMTEVATSRCKLIPEDQNPEIQVVKE
eukprot:TRINITY_DN10295_c0_g1_i1.p1 TRINITY_DN10295_c0_g1~~TRINITY_DN10295_c0_g1_i1.p1  ORF type:complete len:381 (+),score=67.19 TRINITY_DN10295_c0_g1_i1:105-1247(+)